MNWCTIMNMWCDDMDYEDYKHTGCDEDDCDSCEHCEKE